MDKGDFLCSAQSRGGLMVAYSSSYGMEGQCWALIFGDWTGVKGTVWSFVRAFVGLDFWEELYARGWWAWNRLPRADRDQEGQRSGVVFDFFFFFFWVVLRGARSYPQWSLWVPPNSQYTIILTVWISKSVFHQSTSGFDCKFSEINSQCSQRGKKSKPDKIVWSIRGTLP